LRIAVPQTLTRASAQVRPGRRFRLSGPTMGVEWSADFLCPPQIAPDEVERAIRTELAVLCAEISHWDPVSALNEFNHAPADAWVDLPPRLLAVVDCGLTLARETGGAFDPAIGALVDLWGFGPLGSVDEPPTDDRIEAARAVSGWERLSLTGQRLRQPGGLRLDLSGIGKGYGVDRIVESLTGFGVRDYLVEIGGELRGAGVKPDGEPWWVRLEAPPGLQSLGVMIALHDLAVATSGDWRRFMDHDGRWLPHTLDPRTGRPIETGIAAVSVLHTTAMEADAACTVLSVLRVEEGIAWAEARGVAAILTVRTPGGFQERLTTAFQAMLDD
jgi:thiamine biosynthesis lipoprotein